MIDIHSHAMPFVDDGSKSLDRAIRILEEERDMGVTAVILTPHHRGKFCLSPQELKKSFEEFCKEVVKQNLPIQVYLGQEIHVNETTKTMLKNGELLTMNGTNFILLEFDYKEERDIADIVYEFKHMGYTPIVAHLERYTYLTLEDAMEIKSIGGLIQVNADSFFVRDKLGGKKRARKLLKAGLIDFVGSDMHENRTNYLKKAYSFVKKRAGAEQADNLFYNNAKTIIEG